MPSRYISGENEEQEHVKITEPVLTEFNVQDGKRRVNKKMCFYLGRKQQVNPPTPTDPDVKIFKPDKDVDLWRSEQDLVHIKHAKKFI